MGVPFFLKAALEIALLKGAGKYLEGTGASVLVSGVKKNALGVVDGAKGVIQRIC